MSQRFKIIVFFLGITLVALLSFIILYGQDGIVSKPSITKDDSGFQVEAKYQGNNGWNYTITGKTKDCANAVVDANVDNLTDVEIKLEIVDTSLVSNGACSDAQTDFEKKGTFNAARTASLDFVVEDNGINNEDALIIEKDGFKLIGEYKGDRNWGYTITGTLPNPCYTAVADEIVAESFPEQVTVLLTVTEPSKDKICIQEIQELKLTGEYQADEKATLNMRVMQK